VNVGGRAVFFSGWRAEISTGAYASWGVSVEVFILGFQVGVFKSGRFVNSWFPFFDGVSLPTTSR
jgi:hypothetical protein